MPEGNVVWQTARRLDQALTGQTLTRSDFRVPQLATVDLTGDVVTGIVSRGKHLLTRTKNGLTVHTHLRMDGSWQVRPAAEPLRDSHRIRLILANEDWRAVGFQLGVVELIRTSEESTITGHLGPDLLGPDWDAAEAVRRLSAEPDRPIGEALLDQRNLAGVGNVYKAEVLFLRGINPWQPGRGRARSRRDGGAGPAAARRQQGALRPHHHRQHAPGRGALGVRPARAAVPSLRHADSLRGAAGPDHLLVPLLPARPERMMGYAPGRGQARESVRSEILLFSERAVVLPHRDTELRPLGDVTFSGPAQARRVAGRPERERRDDRRQHGEPGNCQTPV